MAEGNEHAHVSPASPRTRKLGPRARRVLADIADGSSMSEWSVKDFLARDGLWASGLIDGHQRLTEEGRQVLAASPRPRRPLSRRQVFTVLVWFYVIAALISFVVRLKP
jgi:hypothetical protein